MSTRWLTRRRFLTVALATCVVPGGVAEGEVRTRRGAYTIEVGILHDMLTFRLDGTVEEQVDRGAGRYQVTMAGQGMKIANRLESQGRLIGGRWAPVRSRGTFEVAGRDSRSDIAYDWDRGRIDYHTRAETFFLRRQRVVDDVVTIPSGQHVDDPVSAVLNHADGLWPADPDGVLRTLVVRRRRAETEGPEDVQGTYRAELVPFVAKLGTDPRGVATVLIDMTRFSSWARSDQPARVVLGPGGRPSLISSSLILGTSVAIRFTDA